LHSCIKLVRSARESMVFGEIRSSFSECIAESWSVVCGNVIGAERLRSKRSKHARMGARGVMSSSDVIVVPRGRLGKSSIYSRASLSIHPSVSE
jgi:hypothetical protein